MDNYNRWLQGLVIEDFLETVISMVTHKPLLLD